MFALIILIQEIVDRTSSTAFLLHRIAVKELYYGTMRYSITIYIQESNQESYNT